MRNTLWMLSLLAVTLAWACPVGADTSKVDPDVWRALESAETAPVWIFLNDKNVDDVPAALRELEQTYNERAIERRRLRRTAPGLFDIRDLPVAPAYVDAIEQRVERLRTRSRWLNAVSADARGPQIEVVARLPFVRSIRLVARSEVVDLLDVREVGAGGHGLNPGDFYGLATDQLQTINLPPVHSAGWTGEGLIIGVLDTGFKRTHSAFENEENPLDVIAEYDFINDDPNTAPESGDDPNQHVHGTIILGTLAAYDPGAYVGAAYDASFILCKTEDITDEYQAEEDFYVSGLEFIESNGGDVATSSLRYIAWYTQDDMDGETAVTTIAVNTATDNGVYCCTAVGNDGHDQNPETSRLGAPADAFDVFSVGSVNIFGEPSGFSSDGPTADGRPKPEVLTVGEAAFSISPSDDDGYIEASGTSMATPQMAAAVACLAQSNPAMSVARMRDAFLLTASYYEQEGTYDPLHIWGYGIVDAFAALESSGPASATLTSIDVATGAVIEGGVAELGDSDDSHLHTRSGFGSTLIDLHLLDLRIDATTDVQSPALLDLIIESRLDEPGGSAKVALRNWASGDFDTVGQYSIGTVEETVTVEDVDASDYIAEAGDIELRVRHTVFVPFLAFQFDSFFDLVRIDVE